MLLSGVYIGIKSKTIRLLLQPFNSKTVVDKPHLYRQKNKVK